jgi:hypothetical protein
MDRRILSSRTQAMGTRPDPDDFHGALVVVAAAAGLIWALARHRPSEDVRVEPALTSPPDSPRPSR